MPPEPSKAMNGNLHKFKMPAAFHGWHTNPAKCGAHGRNHARPHSGLSNVDTKPLNWPAFLGKAQ